MGNKPKPIPGDIILDSDALPIRIGFESGVLQTRLQTRIKNAVDKYDKNFFRPEHYFGMFLPQEMKFPEYEKIEFSPWIILSNHSIVQLRDLASNYGIKAEFEKEPIQSPSILSWSLDGIRKFNDNINYEEPKADELFLKIKKMYESSIYFADVRFYTIQSLWDMATYFFDLFPSFPYMNLYGKKGTAKTKVMQLSRLLSFNSTPIMTSASEASVFRMVDAHRPTLFLDELENLVTHSKGQRVESPLVPLLNAGAYKGGTVPRVEKIDGRFITMYYTVYGPKMFASINGIKDVPAIESRSITNVMTSAVRDKRMNVKVPDTPLREQQDIRDALHELRLTKGLSVQLMLSGSDISTYKPLDLGPLMAREADKWKPLLCIARLVGDDVYDEVLKYAEELSEIQTPVTVEADTWQMKMLVKAWTSVKNGEPIVPKDIHKQFVNEKLTEKEWVPRASTIGRELSSLGFDRFKRRNSQGVTYQCGIDDFKNLLENQDIELPEEVVDDEPIKVVEEKLVDFVRGNENGADIEAKFGVEALAQAKRAGVVFEKKPDKYGVLE